jgi:hypothetical protein
MRSPCGAERGVLVLGSGVDLESSGMVRDACGDADQFTAQSFAVGPSVRLVVSGECLEPRRDVEPEQCCPHLHDVDRLRARGHLVHGHAELRVLDLLLDERPHAEPCLDLGDVTGEIGDDDE